MIERHLTEVVVRFSPESMERRHNVVIIHLSPEQRRFVDAVRERGLIVRSDPRAK